MVIGDSYNRGEKIDSSKFAADPGLAKKEAASTATAEKKEIIPTAAFRCKKCRRVVALQENVVTHVPGEGESSFEWHRRSSGKYLNKYDEFECTSIFIEPLRWMKTGITSSVRLILGFSSKSHTNYDIKKKSLEQFLYCRITKLIHLVLVVSFPYLLFLWV